MAEPTSHQKTDNRKEKAEALSAMMAKKDATKPESAQAEQGSGRLRVCGYLGDCGRVYSVLGRTVEISNLAPRFAKEDLRVLAHEMLDLVRILDRKDGVGA